MTIPNSEANTTDVKSQNRSSSLSDAPGALSLQRHSNPQLSLPTVISSAFTQSSAHLSDLRPGISKVTSTNMYFATTSLLKSQRPMVWIVSMECRRTYYSLLRVLQLKTLTQFEKRSLGNSIAQRRGPQQSLSGLYCLSGLS